MWKDKTNWLRYGIYVAIGYPIIYHLLVFAGTSLEKTGSKIADYFFFPIFIMYIPVIPFMKLLGANQNIFVGTIIMIILGFIIGTIIGLITNKIKKKNL